MGTRVSGTGSDEDHVLSTITSGMCVRKCAVEKERGNVALFSEARVGGWVGGCRNVSNVNVVVIYDGDGGLLTVMQ